MKKVNKVMTKGQKKLLIAMLVGDGTICSNGVYKLSHAIEQEEYLKWKISRLNDLGIKNNGIKYYTSSCGYNKGKGVCYSQLSCHSTIFAMRKAIYSPKKTISKKLLSWLNEEGLAIWYMDDGTLNINESTQRRSPQYVIRIAACENKSTAQDMCNYMKEQWNINFHIFPEGKNTFSVMSCSKNDCINFLNIVKPYILKVPSMLYKMRKNGTKEAFLLAQKQGSKCETLV